MTALPRFVRRSLLALTLALAASAPPLHAHYLDIAQFSLYPGEHARQFRVEATLPLTLDPLLAVDVPADCRLLHREHSQFGESWRVDLEVACTAETPGDIRTRWGRDGFIVRQYAIDGSSVSRMSSGREPGASLAVPDWHGAGPEAQSFGQTALRYLTLGAVHVLEGWDHLAFVFCLALLATGMPLLALITAFTVGHSVSLALAHFGLIRLPLVPVEAIIALSIVFIAREAWLRQFPDPARPPSSTGARLMLAVLFGLVHGLGFASVLQGLGVDAGNAALALAFFNIGVEVGQISFVLGVLVVIHLLRRLGVERRLVPAMTCLVGGLGIYWTLERVLLAV